MDLSFWRFVIIIKFSKSLLWGKHEDTYFFHIGTFTDGKNIALKIVILAIAINIGFMKKGVRGK